MSRRATVLMLAAVAVMAWACRADSAGLHPPAHQTGAVPRPAVDVQGVGALKWPANAAWPMSNVQCSTFNVLGRPMPEAQFGYWVLVIGYWGFLQDPEPDARSPMPDAQCPNSFQQSAFSNQRSQVEAASCRMSNAQCSMFNAQSAIRIPNSEFRNPPCPMPSVRAGLSGQADSAPTQPAEAARRDRSRRVLGPLLAATAAGLALLAAAMIVWTIHWGRLLRRRQRSDKAKTADRPDPWTVAGQRLRPDDQPDRREEQT